MVTLALTVYEESLCPGCGQPKDAAYNPDAEGWYEAHEITCAGCKAQQDHGGKQKKSAAGAKTYVVDTRPPDVELKPWRLGDAAGMPGEER